MRAGPTHAVAIVAGYFLYAICANSILSATIAQHARNATGIHSMNSIIWSDFMVQSTDTERKNYSHGQIISKFGQF